MEEIRGKLINESTVKMANGETYSLKSPTNSGYEGKNVVIRNIDGEEVITERLDS